MQLLCVQLHCTLYTVLNYIVHCTTFYRFLWFTFQGHRLIYHARQSRLRCYPRSATAMKNRRNLQQDIKCTWHWMMKDPGHFLWPNSDGHELWTMESGLCCVMKQCAAVTTQLSAIKVPAHPPWYRQGEIFVAGSLSQKKSGNVFCECFTTLDPLVVSRL